MRTVLASILFGQTIGILPAVSASFTPFSCLDSYVMINDDPENGQSTCEEEVDRLSEIIKTSASMQPGQYALIISDEILNGTNKHDASAISYAVLEKVAKHNNSLWMVSTHYPLVLGVEAATKGIFANYRVLINRNPDGSFKNFTFKIEPGMTNESTVLDLLQQVKMPSAIISRARELIGKQK